jgi:predicted LPLAT superfamily acyltransferase
MWGVRFLVGLVTLCGRGAGRVFVAGLVFWYVLSRRSLRADTRAYLRRVGEPITFSRVYHQVLRFGQCAIDRVFFLRGRGDAFDVKLVGHEHLVEVMREGRGALLLGAHLGSFEVMRFASVKLDIPIHVVMNTSNARMAQRVLSKLDPEGNVRILEASDGPDFAVRLKQVVEDGEVVAILADRAGPNDRSVKVDFLGTPAPFPAGPFLVAAALACPVYTTFGIYRGGSRYELFCDPFADPLELPRAERAQALHHAVARFVGRLEHHCRTDPDNWFNFFDFWGPR